MRVLIIEDEAPAYRRLSTLLQQEHPDLEIIEVLDSVSESLKWLRNHQEPELIFSDIQLADGLSFEIYKQHEVNCPIIFTTAYDDYMLDAFQTNGIDYLLKPIEAQHLSRSIGKCRRLQGTSDVSGPELRDMIQLLEQRQPAYKSRFLVKLGTQLLPVQVSDIAYFQTTQGGTDMVLKQGRSLAMDPTLDELQKQLDPNAFFRINRQVLAHISSIAAIHQYSKGKLKVELHPASPELVLVSREKARAFKNWIDGN